MALFDTTEATGKGDGFILATKPRALMRAMVQSEKLDIAEMELAEGEMCCVVTCKLVNAFAFVASAVRRFGKIDQLAMATYQIGMGTANTLAKMIRGGTIRHCDLLVNDNMRRMKSTNAARLIELHQSGTIALWWQNNHAKTFAIRCGDVCLSIVGSGNLTENGRVEQYIVVRSKSFYEWNKRWICQTDLGSRRSAKA